MMKTYRLLFVCLILLCSCKKDTTNSSSNPMPNPVNPEQYYFPPITGDTWTTKSADSVGWNATLLQSAFDYAGTKNSFGMIILHNGRIVKEQYWNGWTKDTRYYIASAGKSVVALLTGIANQNGLININNKTADYLGTGWTSLTPDKEALITIKNNLSMTTGLEDNVPDDNCEDPACLMYKADAGTRWAYHNAPYRLLQDVLANASGKTFNQFSKDELFNKIGMPNSVWINNVMWCTTREAARFGSLILKRGKWDNTTLLADQNYFNAMTNSSQTLNNSYGYLWWLNGKSSYMVPRLQTVFPGSLVSNAPADMIMALGKDDKKIYVVPSLNVVVVRLGDAAGTTTLGPSSFDNELWARLKAALGY